MGLTEHDVLDVILEPERTYPNPPSHPPGTTYAGSGLVVPVSTDGAILTVMWDFPGAETSRNPSWYEHHMRCDWCGWSTSAFDFRNGIPGIDVPQLVECPRCLEIECIRTVSSVRHEEDGWGGPIFRLPNRTDG